MLTEKTEIIGFTERLDERMTVCNFDVISHTKGTTSIDHSGVYWKRQDETLNTR